MVELSTNDEAEGDGDGSTKVAQRKGGRSGFCCGGKKAAETAEKYEAAEEEGKDSDATEGDELEAKKDDDEE